MNPLWDNAEVKTLAKAVRRTSPDDWKASRRRKGGWRSLWAKVWARIWFAMGALLVADLMCLPFLMDKPAPLPVLAASGLLALNFLGLGLVAAYLLFTHDTPAITPLINTPASGRQVYLYVLHVVRRTVVKKAGAILGYSFATVLLMQLIVRNTLTAESLWKVAIVTIAMMGSSVAMAALLFLAARPFRWVRRLLWGLFFALLIAELGSFFLRRLLPAPVGLGEFMAVLPQAQICQWLATDGALPLQALLGCLGGLPLALFLILHQLRDRGYSFADDSIEEGGEWGAESIAAEAVKRWRQGAKDDGMNDEESGEEENEDSAAPEADEWSPLLVHPSAPQEHSAPVSAEFRDAMASRCRVILQASGTDCPLETCLVPQPPSHDRMKLAWRWALYACVLAPLLCEATAWLPPAWQEAYGFWFILVGLLLIALSLVTSLQSTPPTLPLSLSQWVRIPVDPGVHAQAFFRWQRILLWRRCKLAAGLVSGIAVTSVILIGLRYALDLPVQSPVVWQSLVRGEFSLLCLASFLFMAVLMIRYLEAMKFYRLLFTFIQWRGLWSQISLMYGFVFLLSGAAMFAALAGVLFLTLGEAGDGPHWLFVPVCLLSSEILHRTNRWLALQTARWGRGDWTGEL